MYCFLQRALMTLCPATNAEAKFQRKIQMRSWSMKYHKVDCSDLVHNMPEIKQHFKDVNNSCRLHSIDAYNNEENNSL